MGSRTRTYVIGVGLTNFERPGTCSSDYIDLARQAGTQALADAGIACHLVEHAFASYVFGESCSGHRAVYELGLADIPIIDVSSNCSSGSSALYLASLLIRGDAFDCVLAMGFEKMTRGPLQVSANDREHPTQRHFDALQPDFYSDRSMPAARMFGAAASEHVHRYGSAAEQFAQVAEKNYRHSAANPRAIVPYAYTMQEILDSPPLYGPLTRLQCSSSADGAAAVVLASERFVDQRGLASRAVEIAAQAMVTDTVASFSGSAIDARTGSKKVRRVAMQRVAGSTR